MMDGLDPAQLQQVVQMIETIARAADRLVEKFDKGGAAVKRVKTELETVGKKLDDTSKDAEKRLTGVEHQVKLMFDSMKYTGQQRWGDLWSYADKRLEEHERRWKNFGAELERTLSHARGSLGGIGDAMGLSGSKGLLSGLSSLKSSILSEMPMGGLIGLMLMGEKKQADIGAGGARAAQMFASLGQVSRGVTSAMTKDVGALYERWGIGFDELQALSGGMAEFGASGEAALAKVEKGKQPFGKIFGDDVKGMTLAMDMLTNSPIGSFAKQAAQAAQISGKSFRDAAMDVTAMSLAIRDTGVNTQAFMGSMMQATNTLRVQKQDVKDVAEAYLKLRRGFETRGMTKEQSGAMAMTGIGAIAQGIGGMPEGMQGFIGERVTGKSGVEAIVAMQEGLGTDGRLLGKTAAELGRFARESFGPNASMQKFGLQKVMPGLGVEGARAIVEMAKDMEDGLSYDKAVEKHSGELKKLTETRDSKQSAFEAFMRQMTMSMARVGVDLFKVTVAMAAVLYQSFKYTVADAGSTERDIASSRISQAGDVVEAGLNDAIGEVSTFPGKAGGLFKGAAGKNLTDLFDNTRMGPIKYSPDKRTAEDKDQEAADAAWEERHERPRVLAGSRAAARAVAEKTLRVPIPGDMSDPQNWEGKFSFYRKAPEQTAEPGVVPAPSRKGGR